MYNKKGIILLLIVFFMCAANVTLLAQVNKFIHLDIAGTLKNQDYSFAPANTITHLTLTGNIDARDIQFMRDKMDVLSSLDLSETSIVAYSGTEGTFYGHYEIYLANNMPAYSFENKQSLISIALPLTLTSIDLNSFSGCNRLSEDIFFPSNLSFIADSAFAGCSSLNGNLTFPSNLTAIGTAAFSGCKNISSLYLPSSLSLIRKRAFEFCTGLQLITNTNPSPILIDEDVFTEVDKATCTLTVLRNSIDLYKNTIVWQNFFYEQESGYMVRVTIKNPLYGHVLGEGIYNMNTVVTLTAIAHSGYTFSHWAITVDSLRGDAVIKWDSIISTENPLQFVISQDTSFILSFEEKEVNIKELDAKNNSLYVYPNPVRDRLYVDCSSQIKQIAVYDMTGKKLNQWYQTIAGIDLSDLSKGVYFLKIYTAEDFFIRKIIKD